MNELEKFKWYIRKGIRDVDHLDGIFLYLYWRYLKNRNRKVYLDCVDAIEKMYPELIEREFGQRKDLRSLRQFAADLLDNIDKQNYHMGLWTAKHLKTHFPGGAVVPNGVEDTGRLITQSNRDKSEFKLADFKVTNIAIMIGLELKVNNKCNWKITPKVADFEAYCEDNVSVLFMLYNWLGGRVTHYILASPEQLQRVVSDHDNNILFSHKAFREGGMKDCVQFHLNLSKRQRLEKVENGGLEVTAITAKRYFDILEM